MVKSTTHTTFLLSCLLSEHIWRRLSCDSLKGGWWNSWVHVTNISLKCLKRLPNHLGPTLDSIVIGVCHIRGCLSVFKAEGRKSKSQKPTLLFSSVLTFLCLTLSWLFKWNISKFTSANFKIQRPLLKDGPCSSRRAHQLREERRTMGQRTEGAQCGSDCFCTLSRALDCVAMTSVESFRESAQKKRRNISDRSSFLFHWIPKSLQKLDFEFLQANTNPTWKPSNQRVFSKFFEKNLKKQRWLLIFGLATFCRENT
jgi:hypothetical protein